MTGIDEVADPGAHGADDAHRRALSRRTLIRGAAVATAAGWVAPMLIDSIASPAAAASPPCTPYFVKVRPNGNCFDACPGSGTGIVDGVADATTDFPVTGFKWAGNCYSNANNDPPSGCGLVKNTTPKMPTVTDFNTTYYKVTLATGCRFSKDTGWSIGGRYGTSDPGDRYIKAVDTTCTNATTPGGNACFINGGTVAYIRKTYPTDASRVLNYIYLAFCC